MNKSKIIAILRQDIMTKIVPAIKPPPFSFELLENWTIPVTAGETIDMTACKNGETYLVCAQMFNDEGTEIYQEIDMFYKVGAMDIKTLFGEAKLVRPKERIIEINLRENATLSEIKKAIQETMHKDIQLLESTAPWETDFPSGCWAFIRTWRAKSIWK